MAETFTVQATPTITGLQVLLIGHAVLQILDLSTTAMALQAGGYEANPLARALITQSWWLFGGIKLVMALAFVALWPVVGWMHAGEARFMTTVMAAFAVFMTFVVTNNALIAL